MVGVARFVVLVLMSWVPLGEGKLVCERTPEDVLRQSLDGVFNERYMRTVAPNETDLDAADGVKRNADPALSFYVDENYSRDIEEVKPDSLLGKFLYGTGNKRTRRAVKKMSWTCEQKITWQDLGPNYYPRFLRSMQCIGTCWYNQNVCKPRSVTVKLLRRKEGDCVVIKSASKVGVAGLPIELREKWVWEEKHVNYCCDCVASP